MSREALPIRTVALRSAANLFASWYGFWGFVRGVIFAISDVEHLVLPLGLFIPFVKWQLHLTATRAATIPGVTLQVSFFVLLCAATGWVSGLAAAFVYNLISKQLGFQLRGTIETDPLKRS